MSTNRPTNRDVLDVPLPLDGTGGGQSGRVHAGLRAAILGGRLAAGLRLPSSRSLAAQLGVRRNAVVVAYEHLLSDGLVEARVGAGTYVAARVPSVAPTSADPPTAAPPSALGQDAFALGRTHADPVLLGRLGRAVRRRLSTGDASLFGYGDPRGSEALRAAIARHLAATRGIAPDPARVVVTSGTQQGLRLCAEVLLRQRDAVWVENPGYPAARRTFEAAGARLVPVPVDESGLDVALGRRLAADARAAYVTPSSSRPASRWAWRGDWSSSTGRARRGPGCWRTTTTASSATPARR